MIKERKRARQFKIRRKISGQSSKPRVAIFRSCQHIYAQVIDDVKGVTLTAESDLKVKNGSKTERATNVGENLAKKTLGLKISEIVFDRGGFKYHGRVAALAVGLRKGGLKF